MLREEINQALKDAVRSQNKRRMSTLRLILAAIKDRDIAARAEDKQVSDEDILGILQKMIKQRHESAETYEGAGRLELAEQEREEIVIIEEFLPAQLSDHEVEGACKEVVDEVGAEGLKDMGRIMAALKTRYAGQMDFGKASTVVKDLLK